MQPTVNDNQTQVLYTINTKYDYCIFTMQRSMHFQDLKTKAGTPKALKI